MAFIGNAIRSVFRNPTKLLPAAAGWLTGNPWIGAAAGAIAGASEGGSKGAIMGALGSALGTYAGGNLALNSLNSFPAKMLGKLTYYKGLTSLGSALGASAAWTGPKAASLPSIPTPSQELPITLPPIPPFEKLKREAIIDTQKVFEREGINKILHQEGRKSVARAMDEKGVYKVLNPFRRFKTEIDPYERDKFPSLSKVAKSRTKNKKRRMSNEEWLSRQERLKREGNWEQLERERYRR